MNRIRKIIGQLGFRLIKWAHPNALVILNNWPGHSYTEAELRKSFVADSLKDDKQYYEDFKHGTT